MLILARKSVLAAALGATMLASATPAQANHRREHRDDVTGAVVLGVLTVAAVAVLAGGKDRRNSCDGGRDDPDYCYGGYGQGTYDEGTYQQGDYYAGAGDYYEEDDDHRGRGRGHDRHRGRHHDREHDREDGYSEGGYNQGW